MGQSYSLNVQDSASVERWKALAQDLNKRADTAVKEAGQALSEFKQTAEGTVFDEVCTYSDGMITGMTTVLEGMNKILSTVDEIVSKLKQKIVGWVDDVDNLHKNTLNM